MESLARLLLARRLPAAAVVLAAAIAAAAALRDLEFDLSLQPILVANADEEARVAEFERRVPPRMFDAIVVLSWPEAIDRPALAVVGEVTAAAAERPEVESIRSLANTSVVPPGATIPIPVPFPGTVGAGEAVGEAVARHPLLARRLLSVDGRATPLVVRFAVDGPDRGAAVDRATTALVSWLRPRVPPDVEIGVVGGVVIERAMSRLMKRDMSRTLLLELLASVVLLPLLFRTARGTVLPLSVVILAVLLSHGLLAALGTTVSVLDLAIPGLITIIGLCDAVHLMHRFEAEFARTLDRFGAIRAALEKVGRACLQTSVTTGIGFLSLLVSDHDAVRSFGWKSALSVVVTFLTVVAVLPLALSVWPIRRPSPPGRVALPFLRVGRPLVPLAVTALVVVVSLLGATRVSVDSRWLEEFPPDAPEVLDLREYERRFQGILWLEVELRGALDRPDVLRALAALERTVVSEPDVDTRESVALWVAEVAGNPRVLDDVAIERGVRFLRLAGDAFPSHLVDPTFRQGRIVFRTGDIGTRRYLELAERIEKLARSLPAEVRASVAGSMRLAHESSRLVVTTMLESFLLSLVAITALVSFAYRSLRLGLVSIVPNVLPIVVALGLNGWLDIPLRIGIVMIYALGLGLAVDDTIHLLTRFTQERAARPDASIREALDAALRHTGRALLVTSLLLFVGGLCYLPADFRSMKDVGLLLNAVVVTALLADLFVLPHLIAPSTPGSGIGSGVGTGDHADAGTHRPRRPSA